MCRNKFLAFLLFSGLLKFGVGHDREAILNQAILLVTSLEYGDSCSWENEKLRQEFHAAYDQADFPTQDKLRMEFAMDTVTNQRKLCSDSDLFVCGKETETCICGREDPRKHKASKGYVVEVEDNVKKCRWAKDHRCSGNDVGSRCMQGTTCTAISDGRPCTDNNSQGKVCTCQADKQMDNLSRVRDKRGLIFDKDFDVTNAPTGVRAPISDLLKIK